MIALLDVNVLVALTWPHHVHHVAAAAWFTTARERGWATCPLTESGFVRVSASPAISHGTVTPTSAATVLRRLCGLGNHAFWLDDLSVATSTELQLDRVHGHRQVTDAHMVGLAVRRGGVVATFDRAMQNLNPSLVEVIDPSGQRT